MNLKRVMDLSATRGKMVLAGIVLLAFSLLLAIPGRTDCEKLRSLLDRGHYSAVKDISQQVLALSPEAHEHRELLARAELALGNPEIALEHALLLMEAGWNIQALEEDFVGRQPYIQADRLQTNRVLDVAERGLAAHPDWVWLKQFALTLLFQGEALHRAPAVLQYFTQADMDTFAYLVDKIWESGKMRLPGPVPGEEQ
jgi:hypothetical protein